jgi:hypothetical protein
VELLRLFAGAGADESGAALLDRTEGEVRGLLLELLAEPGRVPNVDAVVEGALNRLEGRRVEQRLAEIDRRMPVASEDEKIALAREKETLSRRMRQLNPSRWKVIQPGRSRAR